MRHVEGRAATGSTKHLTVIFVPSRTKHEQICNAVVSRYIAQLRVRQLTLVNTVQHGKPEETQRRQDCGGYELTNELHCEDTSPAWGCDPSVLRWVRKSLVLKPPNESTGLALHTRPTTNDCRLRAYCRSILAVDPAAVSSDSVNNDLMEQVIRSKAALLTASYWDTKLVVLVAHQSWFPTQPLVNGCESVGTHPIYLTWLVDVDQVLRTLHSTILHSFYRKRVYGAHWRSTGRSS